MSKPLSDFTTTVVDVSVTLRLPNGREYRFSAEPESDYYCKEYAMALGENIPGALLRECIRMAALAEHSTGDCPWRVAGPL